MAPRRNSVVCDPARDACTNSETKEAVACTEPRSSESGQDAAIQVGKERSIQSPSYPGKPSSKKRKTPSGPTTANVTADSPDTLQGTHDAAQDLDPKTEPSAKRARASPGRCTNNMIHHASIGPKAITAANLSELTGVKRPPSERSERPKRPFQRRRERDPANRNRSRSPIPRLGIDTRQDRRTPPRARKSSTSPLAIARSLSRSPPPKQRKRPGAAARITAADADAARKRQQEREEAQKREAADRGVQEAVRQHYNAVPERGREWRKESMIKGLRTFNNWVKSAVIQKFSPDEDYTPGAQQHGLGRREQGEKGLLVVDIGCGKGGDLQKWQSAPQRVDLYVGVDGAEVSVEQARSRFQGMPRFGKGDFRGRKKFEARFISDDGFGNWLGNWPIVRQVGIDPTWGPPNVATRPGGSSGFDVVTMMFSMHYAFESETKTRQMLSNVAACLKKRGRFIGVIPNSDVLTAKIKEARMPNAMQNAAVHEPNDNDDEWDPEKPSEPQFNGESDGMQDDDDWDPEKPSGPHAFTGNMDPVNQAHDSTEPHEVTEESRSPRVINRSPQIPLEWGNSLYRISFPNSAALPSDGTFRPPWGWKYFFFLEEAVEQVPEYVVPWESFRALASDYNLELQYRRSFADIWKEESDEPGLRELSEKMGVRDRSTGEFSVSEDEMEAAGKCGQAIDSLAVI